MADDKEFFIPAGEEEIRRERQKARELRASQWWKRRRSTGVCHYCGNRFPPRALTMDHIVPIVRGGRSAKGNVVAACKECNNRKKHSLAMDWKVNGPVDSRMEMEPLGTFLNGRVVVKVGDIAREDADAVVNAANGALMGGGGVDGAIHRAGGPGIKKECEEIRRTRYPQGLPTGQAVLTSAGRMAARRVIHTVGPVYSEGKDKAALLAACYRNALALAAENGLATIAFPAISTGIYGYPAGEAAAVASAAVEEFLKSDSTIREVRLVFFRPGDAETFLAHQRFSS